ncbi:cytochrome o ubiquinol oxidase subunit IV [Komagataeibacter medellinensis]|uniref:Cytochrome bo(3) ubiquinol oxidase subunit 4 n=3 Tax=Komagataeibacter TaxID=1434011 RepID=G2I2V0_KOMMN|nr:MULTISPECIES: cytochrome o ubiquinol oxidase subunit IV [Komagataeibacter]ATU73408.1 cytochrome o ubiquinol oxidase subunit IV [Komagataeibacter xylinus]KAB8123353.1 cytochrome o ubiquinol oxidase subunit IV [Komagataeibacter medellinensis]KDU94388.1 cytochrome C oxidase subunit III [Komagataeibacter rhaeticus AF1]MCE2566021.1 cytochrome o ubiquinol oxidase subunit IV [Komagataeibacter sp. FNDCF1]MDT8871087.1 cytochrome o ubiquinol oxidase subunit IV [Komagataeibacter rhaeticus]
MGDHISSSGESHGSVGSYLTGFVLAVILTVAAFGLVMSHAMSPSATGGAIALLAVVQIVVHLIYFLHMNGSSEQRWNVMAFVFTVLSVLVLVAGTMFIMHDTSINMMSR